MHNCETSYKTHLCHLHALNYAQPQLKHLYSAIQVIQLTSLQLHNANIYMQGKHATYMYRTAVIFSSRKFKEACPLT